MVDETQEDYQGNLIIFVISEHEGAPTLVIT